MSASSKASADKYTIQVVTKYMCRYCARQFSTVRDMQTHVMSHAHGKTPLNCSVCGRSYSTPSKLQRHIRVHSGERPYICNMCGRRFTRSDHVKQHMKVHLPHRQKNMCRICGIRFAKCQLLGSHLRRHEIYQIHLCHRCGEGFQDADELEKHKKLHNIRGNLRANGRRGFRGVSSEDGELQDPLGKALQGCKWLGCARFCIGQIPSAKAAHQAEKDEDEPEAKPSVSNYKVTPPKPEPELTVDGVKDDEHATNDEESPKMAISACYSLAGSSGNIEDKNFESTTADAETITDGTKMFVVPSGSGQNDGSKSDLVKHVGKSISLSSGQVTAALKAVIKKEPGTSKDQGASYTISLLGKNTQTPVVIKRPFSPTPMGQQVDSHGSFVLNGKRLSRCDHCGIWFEDYAMCMLHNSLHSADESDPFTCRKCLKKLGNRLEFMAHLIWHLDPELQ